MSTQLFISLLHWSPRTLMLMLLGTGMAAQSSLGTHLLTQHSQHRSEFFGDQFPLFIFTD